MFFITKWDVTPPNLGVCRDYFPQPFRVSADLKMSSNPFYFYSLKNTDKFN